jgi:hypothetical protein
MTSPIAADSPWCFTIFVSRPAAGAGTSTVAFSESRTATASSFATASPSAFNHLPISTDVTDSPTGGTFSSMAIPSPPA